MTDYTDEQLADLISALPPAPAGWVQSAKELPAARLAIDALVERAQDAAEQRSVILANLEASLRDAGVEPRRELVEELKARLIGGP
jgi:hypothetical protein